MKKLLIYIPLVTLLSGLGIWLYDHDSSLARASDILKVREEIRQLRVEWDTDQLRKRAENVQDRIWLLESRYPSDTMPQSVREEYLRLQVELKKLQAQGY